MSGPSPPGRAWQRMLSGRRLDLLDPDPRDIAIDDIAHGLARVPRWNGQTAGPHVFSVAQHSLLVDAIVTGEVATEPGDSLAALLHDAPEYVIGDIISPFKAVLDTSYKAVEHRILAAVHAAFGLESPTLDLARRIKAADRVAARCEATALAGFADNEANLFFGPPDPNVGRLEVLLAPLPAEEAQAAFLARFAALRTAMADR